MKKNSIFTNIVLFILLISLITINTQAGLDEELDIEAMWYGPNWDIDHDGWTNLVDVSLLSSDWGDTGTPHYITFRVDINRDGEVNLPDVSYLSTHYGQTWLVTP